MLPGRLWLFSVVTLIGLAVYFTRVLLPSDLADNHQDAPTAYVLDVVYNGAWVCQRDVNGAIASKPPLFVWFAALASKAFGVVNHLTLSLPSALATFGLAWFVWIAGGAWFGWRAGLFAATAYLLSSFIAKQMLLVRSDGLFSFWVAAAALAAWHAWNRGRGWTWFWLASAAATLTKGPLGLVLASGGLLAAMWERRSGEALPLRGKHGLGIALFLVCAAGWVVLAGFSDGRGVFEKLFVKELYQGAINKGGGHLPLVGFYRPPLYFMSRFAPWSIATLIAAIRIYRTPASDSRIRRFERFLTCWLFAGLVLFSLAAHQRADLLMPLLPPAALLAGREIAGVADRWTPRGAVLAVVTSTVVFLGVYLTYEVGVRNRQDGVTRTALLRELADIVRDRVGPDFPLIHARTSAVLQARLRTCERTVTPERALQFLRGEVPVFVATEGFEPAAGTSIYVVAQVAHGQRQARIVSNHPRLEWTESRVHYSEPFLFRMTGVRAFHRRGDEFTLAAEPGRASVWMTNESDEARHIRLHRLADGTSDVFDRVLEPRGQWQVQF
jgi:hypothetical protein